MYPQGDNGILAVLVILILLGAALVIGSRYATRRGYLRSSGSRWALIAVFAMIALAVLFGPFFTAGR